MNLEHPHLGEADEAALVLYIEVLATGFLLLDHHGLEVLRDAGARVLLEEASLALPLGAAEETQRYARDDIWTALGQPRAPLLHALHRRAYLPLRGVPRSEYGSFPLHATSRFLAIYERRRGAEAPRPVSPLGSGLPPRSRLVDLDVPLVEALQLLLGSLTSIAVPLSDGPGQLVEVSVGLGQVVIGELAPLLLHLAAELLPLAGHDVAIHSRLSFRLDDAMREALGLAGRSWCKSYAASLLRWISNPSRFFFLMIRRPPRSN